MSQIRWVFLTFIISFVFFNLFENTVFETSAIYNAQNTFLGLNLFLEILILFVFTTFVVFGVKGFFEMYSHRTANIITFASGMFLMVVMLILFYQILFLE